MPNPKGRVKAPRLLWSCRFLFPKKPSCPIREYAIVNGMKYTFTTTLHKEGKWYVARCVELGVVSQGKTIEEARKNVQEAVELYLEDMPKSALLREPSFVTTFEINHA